MRIAAVIRGIRKFEPLDTIELAGIKHHWLVPACMDNIPERHVRMSGGQAYRCRASDH